MIQQNQSTIQQEIPSKYYETLSPRIIIQMELNYNNLNY